MIVTQLSPGARVARGATYMFAGGFATSVIGLIYFMIITRVFVGERATEMGIFAVLNLILSIAQTFGTLALTSAAVKYIAHYLAEKQIDKAKSVASVVLRVCVVTSILAFCVLFFSAEWLSLWLFGNSSQILLFQALAFVAFFNILYLGLLSFLQGLQKMFEISSINLVYAIIQSFLGIYLILNGWGLLGIVYGWLIGVVVSSLTGLALSYRYLGISRKSHPIRPLIAFSIPLYLSQILNFFVGSVDQIFVLSFMGAGQVLGDYYIAVRASAVPSLIVTSIIAALFPQLSELYARNGATSLKGAFHTSTRYATLIGFPTIIGLATLAYPIVILFAGWEHSKAALPLIILCVSSLPTTLGVAITAILMTMERTKTASLITVASIFSEMFALYVALAYLNWGILGAALSKVFVVAIGFALGTLSLRKNPGISFDKDALWKGSVSCAIMVFAIILLDVIRQYFTSSQQFLIFRLHLLPIYVIVGSVAYLLSLVALRAIKKQDIELAYEYLPKMLKPIARWVERIARVK
jgi:O-antigen/teichoic acid export membrane protein